MHSDGFAADVPADEVDALAEHPSVAHVFPDFEIHASAIDPAELTTGIDRIEADRNTSASPVDVDIAIIDTGISSPTPGSECGQYGRLPWRRRM